MDTPPEDLATTDLPLTRRDWWLALGVAGAVLLALLVGPAVFA